MAVWVRLCYEKVTCHYSLLTRITGKRHAVNFHELTARANVVAACTPDEGERKWAAENLEGVKIYSDYDEMLEDDLDAVVVASGQDHMASKIFRIGHLGFFTQQDLEETMNAVETRLHELGFKS